MGSLLAKKVQNKLQNNWRFLTVFNGHWGRGKNAKTRAQRGFRCSFGSELAPPAGLSLNQIIPDLLAIADFPETNSN